MKFWGLEVGGEVDSYGMVRVPHYVCSWDGLGPAFGEFFLNPALRSEGP